MNREIIFNKFGGRCAYTGKPLGDDWQIDHIESKIKFEQRMYYKYNNVADILKAQKEVDNINNLLPALYIVNHYKRSLDLEEFRERMLNFHKQLAKLPKKTRVPKTVKRIAYMNKVADAFDITVDKPFSGKFYFETIEVEND